MPGAMKEDSSLIRWKERSGTICHGKMLTLFLVLLPVCLAAPSGSFQVADTKDDNIVGLAWKAAAGEINQGREGKFFVPREVTSAKVSDSGDTKTSDLEVLYQESWCSSEEGQDIDDICESMCPLYFGGIQALYHVTVVETSGGDDTVTVEKIKDVENSNDSL